MTDTARCPIRLGLRENLAPVRAARRRQRARRRDDRPGTHRAPAPRRPGVRPHRVHRRADVHRRVRRRQRPPPTSSPARCRTAIGRKPVLVAGWLIGLPVPFLLDVGTELGLDRLRQRAARREPGPHLVDDRHHEDRPRRPRTTRLRDGTQRSRRLRRRRAHRARDRLHRRSTTGCAPSRSSSASPTPGSASGSSTLFVRETHGHARHEAATPRHDQRRAPRRAVDPRGLRAHELHANLRSRRAARPASSTTSTTASPGASSRSTSRPPASPSAASACSPRSTPPVWGLGQLVTGGTLRPHRPQAAHRRRHAHPGRRDRRSSPRRPASGPGPLGAVLLGVGTAMVYPTLLAAIGDVAHPTWRARSGRHLPALARRRLRRRRDPRRRHRRRLRHHRPRSGPSPHSPRSRASSSPSACTKPTPAARRTAPAMAPTSAT